MGQGINILIYLSKANSQNANSHQFDNIGLSKAIFTKQLLVFKFFTKALSKHFL